METKTLTENGISTTKGLGEEKYLKCCLGAFKGQIYYQYDYRHLNGELFSTLRKTLEQCSFQQTEKNSLGKSLSTRSWLSNPFASKRATTRL